MEIFDSARQLFSDLFPKDKKIDTPGALFDKLKPSIHKVRQKIAVLHPEFHNLQCSQVRLNRFTDSALEDIFEICKMYVQNRENRQTERVRQVYNGFLGQYSLTQLKDLPELLQTFCEKIAEIETLDKSFRK